MRRTSICVASAFALSGCVNLARAPADIARYDFGPPTAAKSPATRVALRSVEVTVPSWLDTTQLQYRLLFADAQRRRSYAGSRWIAPPGEVLEGVLRRHLLGDGNPPSIGGCMLRIELEELIQEFRGPQRSEGVISLQAALVAPRRGTVLARNTFAVSLPAATPDARGGVDAISAAAQGVAQRLQDWLSGLDRSGGGGLNSVKDCNGG